MMHIHRLEGCSPAPLAHYLKALGILRQVAEQADPSARGWWAGECFCLATKLGTAEVEGFFLESYSPTPLVAPWNGGTGFYPKDKKAGKAVQAILSSDNRRFAAYKTAIKESKELVGDRSESPDKKEKEAFLGACRSKWRGGHLEGLSASVVLHTDGSASYPSLLGTGLNDGRLDFSSNYMERLISLLDERKASEPETLALLKGAIWGTPTVDLTKKSAIGQFFPGAAGGANSSNATDGDPLINPWDFVFMLEGALVFSAGAVRRLGANTPSRAAVPFAVSAQGIGYASAGQSDESARGEQWMPLWDKPTTFPELKRLLAEGRSQIGAKPASEPLDLARAIARLGTARGISAFQRFGYIERNGQANLAVPLGRFRVPDRIEPKLECLDDLEGWLSRLRREARDKHAPNRLQIVEHRLAESLLEITRHPNEPARWQTVLLHLANAEAVILTNPKSKIGPLPPLRPAWVRAADDGSAELRLACAFALQAEHFYRDGGAASPVRNHWVPRKNEETDRVMQGRDGLADAIAVVERRLILAARKDRRRLPLVAASKAYASLTDLSALIAGEVDLDRTLTLARALMALDLRKWSADPQPPAMPQEHEWPDDAWSLLRLAMLPWPLEEHDIPVDSAMFRRLATGDAGQAVVIATRRLRAAGIVPTIRGASVPSQTARRWAAAMAFPIAPFQAKQLLRRLDPNTITEE
jgi:CRISPR-associated protein Csx17